MAKSEWCERLEQMQARQIERRAFLRGALGVSGLLLLEGLPLRRAAVWANEASGLPNPNESGLEHIVVTMMENRSLDHFFGWIPGIDGVPSEGFANPTSLSGTSGVCAGGDTYPEPLAVSDPTLVQSWRLPPVCSRSDPAHGWNAMRIERNHGLLNGFVDRSGTHAMGYYTREDIPFLGWLGAEFTTFSRYFSSVLGPTYPNRLYWLSGEGGTAKSNAIPVPTPQNPEPTGYTWPTIFTQLSAAGVSWAYYATDLASIWLFFHHMYDDPGRIRHISDYFAEAAAGVLPQVCFLDPSFITVGNDYHPGNGENLLKGERYVHDTFRALAEGPQWESSAYILTFDEAGGWFDHVVPPSVPDNRSNPENHCEDWGQLGFRVPCVIASPFARRQFVGGSDDPLDPRIYDHTSILSLIQWRFGLPPLTLRNAWARNLGEVLDFENTQVELPESMPDVPLPTVCSGDSRPTVPAPPPTVPQVSAAEVPDPHREMAALADMGFFGRYDFRNLAKKYSWRT